MVLGPQPPAAAAAIVGKPGQILSSRLRRPCMRLLS